MKESKNKTLPFSVTKKELVNLYLGQMSENSILTGINAIIFDNRKQLPQYQSKTEKQIILSKLVWHTEFMEFVATYGVPKGYKEPENEK